MKKRDFKKLNIGIKLAAAFVLLGTGNFLALALVMFIPTFGIQSLTLGFTADEENELKTLLNSLGEKNKAIVTEEIRKATEGLVTSKQLTDQLATMGLKDNAIEKINTALTEQGLALKKILEGNGGETKVKTLSQILQEKVEMIKRFASGDPTLPTLGFEFKGARYASKATTFANAVTGTLANTYSTTLIPGVGQLPTYESIISQQFRHAPVNTMYLYYMDQLTDTNNAAMVAEAGVKPTSDATWVQKDLKVEKIADSIVVTKEALEDIAFLESEIDRLLNLHLGLIEDTQLYSGSGLTPNLKGVYTTAPAFVPGTYTGFEPVDANLYDLIAVLRVLIMNSKQSKYNPNRVLMNPADVLRYKLAKAVDGHYILPPFISANGQVIDGIQVIETSRVTANTLVVGDFRYGTIYDREAFNIQIGWVNNQFLTNQVTVLAEKRETLLIRDIDADAFMKVTDITAAIAGITAA